MNPIEMARESVARASLDNCVKCTICETQCPVARVTPLFPGPKYVGPQAERLREGKSVDVSLDLCSGCGICTTVCPQGVKIAEINAQARAVMKAQHGAPLRDRLITQTTLMGQAMAPVAPIANAALGIKPLRKVIDKVMGIDENAPMPTAHGQTLRSWLKKRKRTSKPATRGTLVFFHGCAGGYFEVETSKHSIEVLEHLGYEVLVPKQGCCGLAEQSNGLFDGAQKKVLKLCDDLISSGKDLTIISSSGSCTGMLKHEAREIMGVDDPRLDDVSTRIMETSEFLWDLYLKGELPTNFRELNMKVPYHQPCQVKSQGMGMPAVPLMELIPGVEVVESGEPCCGMAGTYALKSDKYEIAAKVGAPLFDLIRRTNPKIAACETETCRWHIAKGSGANLVHPVSLIHWAYGLHDDLFEGAVRPPKK
ncbi:anaerobic glycerol-3-phosphate dehydrogenase subunit C [Gleimia hominis]|uniref:Anaerobic glycerol-3-phosphate dehydrogenase subunit C n=1 Tax=Gleimia hominis TaxID=595468 RepID=A0ABU3ICC1_9ACTO|nr:anaerobic glycerol-3-phosphate dehydrogenase subunit C [Gleimia hominis]MDT3768025.1 anaerobic glycerol-3-phosphate dehydrogenase subunit C [Gleimia hominis]